MKKVFQGVALSALVFSGAIAAGHIMHVELLNGDVYSVDVDSVKQVVYTAKEDTAVVLDDPYANYESVRSFVLNDDTFKMIKVEGGSFLMGAQSTDSLAANYDPDARANEGPVHSVTLSTFYMAQFETTCNLVRSVGITAGMGSEPDKPIRNIYRKDVLKFVQKLNEIMHETGQLDEDENFTFPTEAQWEYAARGGKYSHGYIYSGSNDYNEVAYCRDNSDHYSFTKVGSFAPNELGLYDMSGNCFEMCLDVWGNYSKESQVDPQSPAIVTDSTKWVMRGGSFYEPKSSSRVTYRGGVDAFTECNSFTLRLALVKGKTENYEEPVVLDSMLLDTSYRAFVDSLMAIDPYANYKEVRTFELNGDTFNMIKVEGGSFLMGAQSTDPKSANYNPDARANEGPVHRVSLSTFYMAQFETTCNLVRSVGITAGMGSEPDKPIRNIYRKDVLLFVQRLNEIMHKNGQLDEDENFTFPTEAQWEYAARGGKYSHGYVYAGSDDYNEVAYCRDNSDRYSFTKVGSFAPNELGLYDMSGNCFEMCLDEWGNYSKKSQINPQNPAIVTDSTKFVMRGGSFYEPKYASRVTYRGGVDAFTQCNSFTLRLALVKGKSVIDEDPLVNDTVDTSINDSLLAIDPYYYHKDVRTFDLNRDTFKMIKVEGGTFLMGAQSTDSLAANYDPDARANEGPVHSVTLSTFYMAQFETTCNLVRSVGITAGMGSESDMPIRNIYKKDILQFVQKLNEIMHANGQLGENEKFTLPTEAQWEYAARGGKYSHGYIYAGSNDYNEVAYCRENSDHYSFTSVGSFAPNELGLYDMSGNCFEMCLDEWGDYSEESQIDPQGPAVVTDSKKMVMRGGSFYEPKYATRVTYRGGADVSTECNSFTLRLCLVHVK